MRSQRLGLAVLILAGAMWAQLVLIPLVAFASAQHAVGARQVLSALVPWIAPVLALRLAASRPDLAVAVALAGFPVLVGLFPLMAGLRAVARFDAPAGIVAAGTTVGFVFAATAWAHSLSKPHPVTVRPLEAVVRGAPPPPLRRLAPAVVGLMAVFLAIVAPPMVSARSPMNRAERLAGEALVRSREAITAAGGLAIALWLVLDVGAHLVRGGPPPSRRLTRGTAFLLWAVALYGLKFMLDRLR